jgi:hypothetical protein
MKNFKCSLEAIVMVRFSDPDKAKAVFIDSDWKESFYAFHDLKDVAEHLSYAIMNNTDGWSLDKKRFFRFIEGFGEFYREGDVYKGGCLDGDAGEIFIEQEQGLEVTQVEEADSVEDQTETGGAPLPPG